MASRILCLLSLLAFAAPVRADDAATKKAVDKAFTYLDKTLLKLPDVSGTPRKPFTYAVAGLDYLMRQATRTKRGPTRDITAYLFRYLEEVERKTADPENLPPRHGLASTSYITQYTWPLSVMGLYFAELDLRGLSRAAARDGMKRVLKLLAAAQEKNGGWGHGRINPGGKEKGPFAGMGAGMGGYPNTLVSSSNCVAICVGLLDAIPEIETGEMVPRARKYYTVARLENGSFPYDPSQRRSGFAKINAGRTAGALFAWHALGMPRGRDFDGSLAYLHDHFDFLKEGHGSPCLNVMQSGMLFHLLGGDEWKHFKTEYFPRIIAKQGDDGGLACICENKAFGVTCDTDPKLAGLGIFGDHQRAYTTSLHLFVLLLEKGELKVLKTRKPGAVITQSGRHRK